MLIGFTHDLRAALAGNLIAKGHAQITQRNSPAPTIEHGAERAEQKGQPITSFARQKRNEFRGGFEPQPRNSFRLDRKSTRLNSSHVESSYAVVCLKKKTECLHNLRCQL